MAHPDLNELLNTLLSVAQMLLTKQGEFLPIGAIMLSDGEIRHVGAQIEGDDHPGSQPLWPSISVGYCEGLRRRLFLRPGCLGVHPVCPARLQLEFRCVLEAELQ